MLCQIEHRKLVGVPNIDRASELRRCCHHPLQALDKVINVAERTGLLPVAIYRNVLALERLNNEVANYSTIIRVHPWPVRVENPNNFDLQTVLPPVVEK